MNKKRIKILQVVGGMDVGGTETMLMNLYRKVNNDFEFHFISYYDGYYDNEIIKLGGKVIKLKKHNKANVLKDIKNLINIIREEGPYEAVHAHTLFNCGIAMIAAKICGIKIRISHAHTTFDSNKTIFKKIYIKLMKNMINIFSTTKLYCSRQAGEYLFGKRYLNDKSIYFPNTIDYSRFIQNNTQDIQQFKNIMKIQNKIILGNIGRFIDAKNHKFMIKVLKAMNDKNIDTVLLLAGEGHMKKEIENLASEYKIADKIKFLGIRKDVDVILKAMDVFIFPSIYEGLGLVMLEAQASGIPCVVSEAIPPEADLGLGLVTKLSLEDDVDRWINEILKSYGKKINDKNCIIKAFEQNEYSIDKNMEKLKNIYSII